MGSIIEINDTLQITKEQGFPDELNLEKHLVSPFKTENFVDKVFAFKDKKDIRIYQIPPVRIFWRKIEVVNGYIGDWCIS